MKHLIIGLVAATTNDWQLSLNEFEAYVPKKFDSQCLFGCNIVKPKQKLIDSKLYMNLATKYETAATTLPTVDIDLITGIKEFDKV